MANLRIIQRSSSSKSSFAYERALTALWGGFRSTRIRVQILAILPPVRRQIKPLRNSVVTLKKTIEMLSMGSAEAVTTLHSSSLQAEKLKNYLYVRTPVEKALTKVLAESTSKRILFLCGSSGDGKSEVFRRIHEKYASDFDFHLDATHSFDPGKNAIQTLDDRFREYKSANRPLVVGINIGMLANYEVDGADEHNDIKNAISHFLKTDNSLDSNCIFINFESYPKFLLKGQQIEAPFIGSLLQRICAASDSNPIYSEFLNSDPNTRLHQNFKLLCVPEIQNRICALLFYAHLKFDQFLTARTILDFAFQILSGPGTLFDNLFAGHGSELVESLQKLDPCHARSKRLDLFQVKASLGLHEAEFETFRDSAQREFGLIIKEPRTWVRLFYMMQDVEFSNNYHHRFRDDLKRDLFDQYRAIWQLHRDYDGNDKGQKTALRDFYSKVFVPAITRFANRFAPEIPRNRFLLGKPNGFAISATATMQPEMSKIEENAPSQLRFFEAYLRIGHEHHVRPVPITVNFLELACRINAGYRPNTHDKTTVVQLEEVVEEVRRIVKQTQCLRIQKGAIEWDLTDDEKENEINVERR
jgi:DNA phosphorothioation-dependent restriction protein DptF